MKIIKYVKSRLLRKIVSLDKKGFFYTLRAVYKDTMIRRLNVASDFSWDNISIQNKPERFEDLSSLFFCSPLSRGVLRQDIDEAALLFKVISRLQTPKGVEIGRFYGGSTILIASAIGAKGHLTSIDLAPKNNDKELIGVLDKLGLSNRVELIIADANQVNMEESFDFAFIDGDHSYEGARLDHNKWGKLVKTGGFIIHHDMSNARKYSVQWNDLAQLYTDILNEQKGVVELFEEAGSMVVLQRQSDEWIDISSKSEKLMTNKEGTQSKTNSYLDRE